MSNVEKFKVYLFKLDGNNDIRVIIYPTKVSIRDNNIEINLQGSNEFTFSKQMFKLQDSYKDINSYLKDDGVLKIARHFHRNIRELKTLDINLKNSNMKTDLEIFNKFNDLVLNYNSIKILDNNNEDFRKIILINENKEYNIEYYDSKIDESIIYDSKNKTYINDFDNEKLNVVLNVKNFIDNIHSYKFYPKTIDDFIILTKKFKCDIKDIYPNFIPNEIITQKKVDKLMDNIKHFDNMSDIYRMRYDDFNDNNFIKILKHCTNDLELERDLNSSYEFNNYLDDFANSVSSYIMDRYDLETVNQFLEICYNLKIKKDDVNITKSILTHSLQKEFEMWDYKFRGLNEICNVIVEDGDLEQLKNNLLKNKVI